MSSINEFSVPNDMFRLKNKKGETLLVAKPGPDAPADPRTGFRDLDPLNEERKQTIESYLARGFEFDGDSVEAALIPAGSLQPKNEPINSDKVTLTLGELSALIKSEAAKAVAEANAKAKAPAEKPAPSAKADAKPSAPAEK